MENEPLLNIGLLFIAAANITFASVISYSAVLYFKSKRG